MHLEEFSQGRSPWHRMDPRVKILGALAFALVTAVSTRPAVPAVSALLGAAALATAGLDLKEVGKRLLAVNAFILFLWFFLPFTTPGETVAGQGWLAVSREGLLLGLSITLKANAVAMATIALLGTSSIFHLVHGLVHLKVPNSLVQIFFFTYRYISVIHREYLSLRSSMRLRCFRPRTDLHTYRSYAYLLGMLFVRSFDRSERIYQAMILRGFTGTFWTLDHFEMRRTDWAALALMALCVLLLVILQTTGFRP